MLNKLLFWLLFSIVANSPNTHEKRVLLDMLKLNAYGPKTRCLGICHNISSSDSWCDLYAADWHRFSGNSLYPVPDPEGNGPKDAYRVHRDMWVGIYGKYRVELLEYVIGRIRTDIKGSFLIDTLCNLSNKIAIQEGWKP